MKRTVCVCAVGATLAFATNVVGATLKEVSGDSAIPYRGVVEGFYGPEWSHAARLDLIDRMGKWGLNTYIYGPKDDPYHHKKWTEPYPPAEAKEFQEYLVASGKANVHFFWALHLGDAFPKDVSKHAEVYANVFRKLELMYGLGVRAFALFFDDFGADNAKLHAEICNRVKREFLDAKGDCANLVMCPNVYWDDGTSAYCKTLGEALDASVNIIWTGPGICTDIPAAVAEKVQASYRRAPFVWWNWPVNDYCRHLLVMGRMYGVEDYPYAGFVMNPMEHCEASKQAVHQLAAWCRDPKGFDSHKAHAAAIDELYPKCAAALKVFAAHNADTTFATLRRDESVGFEPSAASFAELKRAAADLKRDLPAAYPVLWKEIAPWVESFADEAELGCKLFAGENDTNLLARIAQRKEKSGSRVIWPFLQHFSATPAWLDKKIDAALARYRAWKGEDETVVFPITTDLHDWNPDINPKLGPDKEHKQHIPYALRVGDRFGADFQADLGDIGSDLVAADGKLRPATRDEQRRRQDSQVKLYDTTARPVFQCVGNHDLQYAETVDGKSVSKRITPAEFGKKFAQLAHGVKVVWGAKDHQDYCYWDVPGKNCRVIVLDSFEYGYGYGFKPEQVKFLERALDVPKDVTVVALMHSELHPEFACWTNGKGVMGYRNKFNGHNGKLGNKEVTRLFEDFAARGGKLAGILSGHSHYDNDMMRYDVRSICRQGHGWVNLKTEMPHENGAKYAWFTRGKDTLIDVVAIKPKTGELKIFRVGADDEKGDF